MNYIDALKWRYACKAFDPKKKLNDNQINTLKEGLNLTASSYGLQPYRFLFIENNEKREVLVPHSFGQRQVADASHLIVLAVRTDIDVAFVDAYINNTAETRGIPLDAFEGFKNMMYAGVAQRSADWKFQWAKSQAYIALGNLLSHCALEQIDATPMEGFMPAKYDELLGLDSKQLKSVLLCPVGFRSEDDAHAKLAKVRQKTKSICLDIN
ncbi:MAG: NAD(P)H-dependent oxidoreductase [Flavobacteriales bacterium]